MFIFFFLWDWMLRTKIVPAPMVKLVDPSVYPSRSAANADFEFTLVKLTTVAHVEFAEGN